jgi:hypothetical protein
MLRKCLAIFMVLFAVVGTAACADQSGDQSSRASDSSDSGGGGSE